MLKKTFQCLGIAGLIAWTLIGLLTWSKVKDGVQIVLSSDSTEASEGSALLADRVNSLSSDLDALVASLDSNFALVARAIEEGEAEQAMAQTRIQERLKQLETALPHALSARETAGALSAVLTRLELLTSHSIALAAPSSGSSTALESADVMKEGGRALTAEESPSSTPESTTTPDLERNPSPEAPKKTSFLAFNLPSRDFQFAGEQDFEVLGDISRVGFDAKSTLHDFSGVSNRVSGSFRTDLAQPEAGIRGSIKIATNSLSTDLEGRDEAMLEHLNSVQETAITFAPSRFVTTKSDAKKQEVEGRVLGQMTIRGVSKEIEMAVQAHVDESRRLVIQGEVQLLLSDYGVPIPDQLGLISMEDEVRVWIHLRTRAKAVGAPQ